MLTPAEAVLHAALAALGDATRRQIFEKITRQPSTVGALARGFPVTRSAVSQHLRVLKLARLVVDEPQGPRRLYRLDPVGISALEAWIRTMRAFAVAEKG